MRVLIGCEKSGKVRDAFLKLGHKAISCDLQPSDSLLGEHYQGDIFDLISEPCDLFIAFPPCTHLSVSGARWFPEKIADGRQQAGKDFFMRMINWPCDRIVVENPIGIMSSQYRKPDQIIQPWMFGHGETKATCLWLKNLPKLTPSNIVEGREGKIWKMPPSEFRANLRSETYQGIANAMAEQWG